MDKIKLLEKLCGEKLKAWKLFSDKGMEEIANQYLWEWIGLDTALQILIDEEYYKFRLSAYE